MPSTDPRPGQVNFLDALPFDVGRPESVALITNLARAYPARPQIETLIQKEKVALHPEHIAFDQPLTYIWQDVLVAARNADSLRDLLNEMVREGQNRAGFYDKIRPLLATAAGAPSNPVYTDSAALSVREELARILSFTYRTRASAERLLGAELSPYFPDAGSPLDRWTAFLEDRRTTYDKIQRIADDVLQDGTVRAWHERVRGVRARIRQSPTPALNDPRRYLRCGRGEIWQHLEHAAEEPMPRWLVLCGVEADAHDYFIDRIDADRSKLDACVVRIDESYKLDEIFEFDRNDAAGILRDPVSKAVGDVIEPGDKALAGALARRAEDRAILLAYPLARPESHGDWLKDHWEALRRLVDDVGTESRALNVQTRAIIVVQPVLWEPRLWDRLRVKPLSGHGNAHNRLSGMHAEIRDFVPIGKADIIDTLTGIYSDQLRGQPARIAQAVEQASAQLDPRSGARKIFAALRAINEGRRPKV